MTTALAKRVHATLADCRTLADFSDYASQIAAVVGHARRRGKQLEETNPVAADGVRAVHEGGKILAALQKGKVGRKKKNAGNVAGISVYASALEEAGLKSDDGKRWQRLGKVDDARLEEIILAIDQRREEITLGGVLKIASGKTDPALSGGVSNSDGYDSDEWYTPDDYIEAAREVLGGIDLDPASCEIANQTVRADRYFSKKDDGLKQDWVGRVWLNPPYSQPAAQLFGEKLLGELSANRTTAAVMVQNASTDTAWFHALASVSTVCLTRGRINFNRDTGGSAANRYGQCFFYFGKDTKKFHEIFGAFGLIGQLR